MSVLSDFNTAMKTLGVPVYPIVCPGSDLPDSYIVTIPVVESGESYGSDMCEDISSQMRATWYDRNGTTGHSAAIRAAMQAAGFTYGSTNYGYDQNTRHYETFVEGIIDA